MASHQDEHPTPSENFKALLKGLSEDEENDKSINKEIKI